MDHLGDAGFVISALSLAVEMHVVGHKGPLEARDLKLQAAL